MSKLSVADINWYMENQSIDEEDNEQCDTCNKKAVWFYMPGEEQYCDDCVPRGCSCNEDENGNQYLDLQGREQPCCEYFKIDGVLEEFEKFKNDSNSKKF